MILFSKKLVRENKCKQKHGITCLFTLMQTTKRWFFTSAPVLYACKYSTHVCSVLWIYFVKKSGIECCLWSAQCTETQARTFDNVKTWVFILLMVWWWSFIENVVFCNISRSNEATLLELEKAMFTGATPVYHHHSRPYTQSKQSKTFHAKFNVKINCEKKWVW